ncbi:serine/threonine-protein kinase [Rhodopirellula halodulae]|uniref:serine/threonine-protein kinase n=1 Tax=Rhodopirellula halodulae TaxID=2894198 RepID=UPI001E3AAD2B|nr:serine/threonine-protein kinase [Rhodopirellula sp. JC737]MCC9657346.1 serine/threonine protein kinase [Rhodopirellula sp. JC737]
MTSKLSSRNRSSRTADESTLDMDAILLECLESLAECEDGGTPQRVWELCPESLRQGARSGDRSGRFVLVEMVKMSMAIAVQNESPCWLQDYFDVLPDWFDAKSAPFDLVMEEIQLRRESGQTPEFETYQQGYPHLQEFLRPLFSGAEGMDVSVAKTRRRGVPTEFSSGEVVDDFEIIQKLGEGAFAHVYLARQQSMSRLVALKVSWDTGAEPQALAQFDHPNIVRVFDQRRVIIRESKDDDAELHLLYMQYHPGGTLAEVVRVIRELPLHQRSGKCFLQAVDQSLLDSAQVVPDRSSTRAWLASSDWPKLVAWVGMQLAEALQTAHDAGVLHRDVKPANVLLTAEGLPQLADFNVAMSGTAGRAGAASSMGGSVGYMAPEHLNAMSLSREGGPEHVKETADLYSLAVLLWELWQGARPFDCPKVTESWTELLETQHEARHRELLDPERLDTPSERVLENVLRNALSVDPEIRPENGAAMGGSLRLAMHPEAARLFDPKPGSWTHWLGRFSPWWLAIFSILLPNVAAGFINYFYNHSEIMPEEMRPSLDEFAIWVNSVAFPLGVGLIIVYTRASARALKASRNGEPVGEEELNSMLRLGYRAASIGGTCWLVAGVVYPLLLKARFEEFTNGQAVHFFASLMICGGVAMVYPLFALSIVASCVHYPRMIRPTMRDPHFERHAQKMVGDSESFLLIAVVIPLMGVALIVFGEGQAKEYLLLAIIAGMIGLVGAFAAYRVIVRTWRTLAEVLANETTATPH